MLSEVIEENKRLKKENREILEYFTKEFVGMRRKIDSVLDEVQSKRRRICFDLLPPMPFSTVEEILNFNNEVAVNEAMRKQLVGSSNWLVAKLKVQILLYTSQSCQII